jgi:hypothetical protein
MNTYEDDRIAAGIICASEAIVPQRRNGPRRGPSRNRIAFAANAPRDFIGYVEVSSRPEIWSGRPEL